MGAAPSDLGRRAPRRRDLVLHLLTLVAALGLALWLLRGQWFFSDDWTFIANRYEGTVGAFFNPHNEHWSTWPVVWSQTLARLVGWRAYPIYALLPVLLYLAAVHLGWRLAVEAGADHRVATLGAAGVAVSAVAHENLLWAATLGINGSVAAALFASWWLDREGRDHRIGLAGLVAAMPFSSLTAILGVAVGAGLWLRGRRREGLVIATVLVAIQVTYHLLFGIRRAPGQEPDGVTGLLGNVGDLVSGVGRHWLAGDQPANLVAALAVVALVGLGLHGAGLVRRLAMPLTAAGAVAFLAVAGRGPAPRHLALVILLTAPAMYAAISHAVGRLSGRWPRLAPNLAAVLLVATAGAAAGGMVEVAGHTSSLEGHLRARYGAMASRLVDDQVEPVASVVDHIHAPDLRTDELRDAAASGRLSYLPGGPVALLEADLALGFRFEPIDAGATAPLDCAGLADTVVSRAAGESASFVLRSDAPLRIELTGRRGELVSQLPSTVVLPVGSHLLVADWPADLEVSIRAVDGPAQLCRAGSS